MGSAKHMLLDPVNTYGRHRGKDLSMTIQLGHDVGFPTYRHCREIEVPERGSRIVVNGERRPLSCGRVPRAIINDRRTFVPEDRLDRLSEISNRIRAATGEDIVVDVDVFAERVEVLVLDLPLCRPEADDRKIRRVVVRDLVPEHLDCVRGHKDQPSARRKPRNKSTGLCEILAVITDDFVVEHAAVAALLFG